MEFNKYQTPIEELNFTDKDSGKVFTWENAPEEIKKDFEEFLNGVPLIRWLVSKDRPYVKDLPRDEKGHAIIDITHPPILENVDYFRPTAIHYKQTGRLTDLRPNKNPNSAYYKWQHEETRRCWNGYLREEDGAFIPGYMYWYLNYSPINLTRTINGLDYQVPEMPDFWEGVWWRMTGWWEARLTKLNFAEISSRGKSKSYSLASGLSRVYTIGDFEPPPNVKVKNQRAVVMAGTKEFLTKDGTLNKFEDMVSFLAENTEYPAKQLQANLKDMVWQRGYIDLDSNTKKGTLNTTLGIAIKEDVGKGRGKRAALIGLEEFGAFPSVDDVYNIALPSVTDGEKVFGLLVLVGTGGQEGNDFSGALNMIYHPKGYGIKSYENVWDIEGRAPQTSIFCFPAYVNRAGCMSDDGISDVTLALFRICCERWIKKYNNPDPMQLTRTKAEYPVTLQDAIMQRDGAYFPTAQLMERLQEIDADPSFYDGVYVGDMRQLSTGEVEFYNCDLEPIRAFPHKTNKIGGAVEIYEMPVRNSAGKIPDGRYIGSCDPIDDDQSTTMSLVSVFIFDLWTDRIVCEWTGRLDSADDCYERVRLILLFYNAKLLYEAHPYSQDVIMADGTVKKWGEVQVGDYLNAPNNKKVKVTDIPVNEYMPIYEITLRDGRTIKASGNHIWSVYTQQQREKPVLLTTEMMLERGVKNKHGQSMFFIPNGGEVQYEEKEIPIDPYTFGLLLAEGCFVPHHCYKNRLQFSSSKNDLEFYRTVIPYEIEEHAYNKNNSDILIPNCKAILKDLGLFDHKSYTKFIPDIYKYNSKEVRLELLKGLMDGDGCATGKGADVFITTSKKLADDICSLCRSLGINASYKKNESTVGDRRSLHYRVSIFAETSIFKLKRKQDKEYIYHRELKGSKAASYIDKTAISEIKFCGFEMGKCVTVDSSDGLYLVGDYVVTHNCNKKGIFTYFKTMNCIKLMMETPSMLKDRTTQKENLNNTDYGINATEGVNAQARFFIKDWLLKAVHTVRVIDGEEQEVTLHNYNFIKQRALIQELIAWNKDGNFDRVSSFGILMFARQEKIVTTRGDFGKNKVSSNYKGNDEFFTKQWEKFQKKNGL